jgi:hypothetical protein
VSGGDGVPHELPGFWPTDTAATFRNRSQLLRYWKP